MIDGEAAGIESDRRVAGLVAESKLRHTFWNLGFETTSRAELSSRIEHLIVTGPFLSKRTETYE